MGSLFSKKTGSDDHKASKPGTPSIPAQVDNCDGSVITLRDIVTQIERNVALANSQSTLHFSSQELIISIKNDWNISKEIITIPFYVLAGDAITLEHEEYVARKKIDSGYDASRFVFSHEPLIPGDTWYLKILEQSSIALGKRLRIGITSCDLVHLEGFQLPGNEEDVNSMPGYWVMTEKFTAPNVNDYFSITISHEGNLVYKWGLQPGQTLFACDVSQPIWIFIDCGQFDKIASIGVSSDGSGHSSSKDDVNGSDNFNAPCTSNDSGASISGISQNAQSNQLPSPVNNEDSECVICCSEQAEMLIYDCGHICLCSECSTDLLERKKQFMPKCPICRKDIKDIIKTFKA